MLKQVQISSIRKMYFERKLGVEQIAARKGISVATVYKYVKPEFETPFEKVKKTPIGKLTPFEPLIRQWLTEDKQRFYKQRHTAKRVYDRLAAECPSFDACYRSVYLTYIRIKAEVYGSKEAAEKPTILAGEAETGCSSIKFELGGKTQTGFVFMLAFPFSTAAFVQIIRAVEPECLLAALRRIYEFIGGVPPVQKFSSSTKLFKQFLQDIDIESELFMRFILYHGFKDEYHVPRLDGSKTCVTNLLKYARRVLLNPKPEIKNLDEFNRELLIRCDGMLDRVTKRDLSTTCRLLFEKDKATLLFLPTDPFSVVSWCKRKINKRGELPFGKHCYYLPPSFINRSVYVCVDEKQIDVRNLKGESVCKFERVFSDKPEDELDMLELLKALRTKPRALLYTKIKNLLPTTLIEFLREHQKLRSAYANAMYEVALKSDVYTAVRVAIAAAERKLAESDAIVRLYENQE